MSKVKPYFQDRLILLILSINTFLALALIITSLLSLTGSSGGYIREYRANLGLDGYKEGNVLDIVAFAAFATIVYIFQLITSIKIYHVRKHMSLIILLLTLILFIFSLLTINGLLSLV